MSLFLALFDVGSQTPTQGEKRTWGHLGSADPQTPHRGGRPYEPRYTRASCGCSGQMS